MYIAKVIGKMVSVIKHKSYDSKKLLIVQRLDLDSHPVGPAVMAIDYIGAGEGDTVLVARTPGLAQEVFQIENAPICELIIAVVDSIDVDKTISEKNSQLPLELEGAPWLWILWEGLLRQGGRHKQPLCDKDN